VVLLLVQVLPKMQVVVPLVLLQVVPLVLLHGRPRASSFSTDRIRKQMVIGS
jgi:hypothetical protein